MTDDLNQDPALYDEQARRMGCIMGGSLDTQIANEEYRLRHGGGNPSALAMLLRAKELRETDGEQP